MELGILIIPSFILGFIIGKQITRVQILKRLQEVLNLSDEDIKNCEEKASEEYLKSKGYLKNKR